MITGWGESGKVILQISTAFFSGAVEKFFGQRWLSRLQTKTDIQQKLFKRKNMTLQVNCQKNMRTETGVVIDEISVGKMDKLGFVW